MIHSSLHEMMIFIRPMTTKVFLLQVCVDEQSSCRAFNLGSDHGPDWNGHKGKTLALQRRAATREGNPHQILTHHEEHAWKEG